MNRYLLSMLLGILGSGMADAQQIHVIAFGAHPDDCDLGSAGTAAKFAAMGHSVKFVAVTNGDAGHQTQGGGDLAKRRRAEAMESARRLGITYEVLDNHDGELLPTVDVRKQIIRRIREWNADIVIAPRPNDYHPDHRYTGVLVQDAAYMWWSRTSFRMFRHCARTRCSCISRMVSNVRIHSGRISPSTLTTCSTKK